MTRTRGRYLTSALATREQSHRRWVLLGLGGLILLNLLPVFGPHLARHADVAIRGIDHLGVLCLTALHHLLAPVHGVFHVLLAGGAAYALLDRWRAWSRLRRMLTQLDAQAPRVGEPVWKAAVGAGLDPARIRVADGLPVPAFTAGWLRPMIFVARPLSARLAGEELAAVLAHEGAHAARRDPLRLSLMRLFSCTLWWVPALRGLADDMADEAEIQADDAAAAGRPLVLASAILSLAEWPMPHAAPPAAVGFYRHDLVARRVRRLAGEPTPPKSRITRRSLAGAAAALALVWASGVMMVHPLPDGTHADPHHCDHPPLASVSHIFCLGLAPLRPGQDCPHAV